MRSSYLIAPRTMATLETNFLASFPAHRVQTLVGPHVAHLAEVIVVQGHGRFRVNVLQVPAEAVALEPLPKFFALINVPVNNVTSA